YDKQFKEILVL
ncbi:hypothetical protein KGM_204921B, partial [Danaus plexippus plexippus]